TSFVADGTAPDRRGRSRETRRELLCGTQSRTAEGPDRMPHYRCPACGVTTHSVGGRFRANACPNCSAPLAPSDRIFIDSEQRHAIHCDLAAEPEAGGAARRVLASLLDDSDDAESEIAALLMTELINNSVEHSGAPERSIVCLDIAVT